MQANSRDDIIKAWPTTAAQPAPEELDRLGAMMAAYMELLPRVNITAHKTPERFALYNVVDSVLPLTAGLLDIPQGAQVADIGTGGGFPGVPHAVLRPDVHFHLFDSVGKKLKIIDEVCAQTGTKNVKTYSLRLEEYGQAEGRGRFDVVTSRAVAHWTILLELALPLLKVGGVFYAYQGEKIFSELEASESVIRFLGGQLEGTTSYDLGEEAGRRYIVTIRKDHATPGDYPRIYGMMLKKPL